MARQLLHDKELREAGRLLQRSEGADARFVSDWEGRAGTSRSGYPLPHAPPSHHTHTPGASERRRVHVLGLPLLSGSCHLGGREAEEL